MRILVTFAVPEEAGPFRRLRLPGVRTLVTGMGAVAARRAVAEEFRREAGYDWVLSCGFCGALDPALRRADVLVGEDSDPSIIGLSQPFGCRPVRIHCAESVLTTATMKADLRQRTGADAVEMESGVVRAICAGAGIRSGTVRVVSDRADEDLPLDFNEMMTKRGGVHFGKLVMEIARRPRMIPGLMRLQKHSKEAAHALTVVLGPLVSALADVDQSP